MNISERFHGRNRATRYLETFLAYESRCGNRVESVFRKLSSNIEPFPNIEVDMLDIGVGNGSSAYLTTCLPKHKINATAIDVVPRFFPLAARKFVLHGISQMSFVTMDMRNVNRLPSFENKFDLVLANDVLYRYTEDAPLLNDLLCCCKKEGYLAIVHSPSHTPWTRLLTQLGNWKAQQYGAEQLLSTLETAKIMFEVYTITFFMDVSDILAGDGLTEEQVDFLIWMLPRSTPLTSAIVDRLYALLQDSSDKHNRIADKRKLILIRR